MKNTPAKPNFTAWFVLQGVISAMHQPEYKDPANDATLALYAPLSKAASRKRLVSRIVCALPYSLQYKVGQMVSNKSRMRHFYFRKKEVEAQTRNILNENKTTQVIVLGAGLDVLSVRLASEYPNVKFIEIDTGESQRFKVATFAENNIRTPFNVEFIEGDLRDPLAGILSASKSYDKNAQTLWIAEGLFLFIPEDGVKKILGEVKECAAPGSAILFTTLGSTKTASAIGHLLQVLYLKIEKSSFVSAIPFNKVPSLMNSLGFRVTYQLDCDALHKRYMQGKFDGNQQFMEDIHIAVT